MAKLAGLPSKTLILAKQKLKALEKKRKAVTKLPKQEQMSFFMPNQVADELVQELQDMDLEKLTPIEAFQKLVEFKQKASR